MNHAQCEELMAVYRDLADDERQAVDAHVAACATCAAILESYRAMDRALAAAPQPSPGPHLRERYYAAADRTAGSFWHRARVLADAAGWVAVATVMAALLAGIAISVRPLARQAWPAASPGSPAVTSTPPATSTPGPTVAEILANPPAAGESFELDAYYSGTNPWVHHGPPPDPNATEALCPSSWASALTDRPFVAMLSILNGSCSNALPADGAWLVAVTPEMATPGVRTYPQLPYHARLRGHLIVGRGDSAGREGQPDGPPGDPAFAHCPDAARIFMVEEVVQVYEQEPPAVPAYGFPAGYASWPRYHDAAGGYSLPYPPDWLVEPQDAATVLLRAPDWPGWPVSVRVHEGETRYDQYDPSSVPPLMQGNGWGVFEQGLSFGTVAGGSQRLAGYHVLRGGSPGEREEAVLFSANGRTYELSLRYPTGFDSPQPLLTAYTAIVEGFQLDAAPGPSPTPPVHQRLGAGPFLSQEEALAKLEESQGQSLELLSAWLTAEATARRWGGPAGTFTGHPEGVWMLTARGQFEGQQRTMLFYLDAVTGATLGGEEITPTTEGELSIRLGDEPGGEVALSIDDITAYDPATHEMSLTQEAAARLAALTPPTSGLPFVVCVGSEAIYRGAFWPSYSSQSYDGVVIDPILAGQGAVRIELGYPSGGFFSGEDPRADRRILEALERAGKLGAAGTMTPAMPATATPVGS